MATEISAEAPRGPAMRQCATCGMNCRIRGLAMHERACERHFEDDDEYEFSKWVEQRKKLWRYRHRRDGQTRLEEVV